MTTGVALILGTTSCGEDGASRPAATASPSAGVAESTSAERSRTQLLPQAAGPLKPGRYRTTLFNSQLTFTVPAGWQNFGGSTPEFLTVGVSTNPFMSITFIRVTRVVRPTSTPKGDVPNKDLLPRPKSLIAWTQNHPRLKTSGRTTVTTAGRLADRIDAVAVKRYRNAGCGATGCVALFGSEDGSLDSIAAQPGGYIVRNYVFRSLGQDFVVGVTAPPNRFADFARRAERVLAGARFEAR